MPKAEKKYKTLHLVDAELRPVLQVFSGFEVNNGTLEELRDRPSSAPLSAPSYKNYYIQRPQNAGNLRLLVIKPKTSRKKKPALLYMHGGGFVFGSPESILPTVQALAAETGRIIILPQYRLAPEFPYPAALDDNLLALKWMHDNSKMLNLDIADIALGGDSAGGGHAVILTAAIREMNKYFVSKLLLIYPMLDDRTGALGGSENITGEFVWTAENNRFGWECYLGSANHDSDILADCVPARLKTLRGFPPVFLATGSLDLFMEENIRFIERLQSADVEADIFVAQGAYHGFNVVVPDAKVSREFHAACVKALN